jgi:hypothetical protein
MTYTKPKLDEEKIKALIKPQEEVQQFIDEQRKLYNEYKGHEDDFDYTYGYDPFGQYVLEEFLGEEFMRETALPQHQFMAEEDMPVHERCFSYYPAIWKELCKIKEQWRMDTSDQFRTHPFVEMRMDFINRYPANRVRWLSFLRDHSISKEQWAINFGKNMTRHFDTYLMQIYHIRYEFTPRQPYDTQGNVNIVDKEAYRDMCRSEAMELMREMYIYNRNMACAGYEAGEI